MIKALSKDKWKYALYTVSHPADGFYEIRHRERGSVLVAIILTMLFSFSFSINRISACFIVNDVDPRSVDSFDELCSVLILFILLAVGNWSITCLMDGKGRLKDILIAIGYSTIPATVCILIGTFISQFITLDEAAFYYMVIGVGIAYTLFMMLIGIMTVHNFTLGKTLITLFLTLIAVLLIIFVLLLLVNLINQVYSFLHSIYQELIFRS
ncbi:Yip1 domain-containing protein [Eubacterium ruminantium]|nr:Yip1 domain-containing protein [Eubacterium ruminantium]